MTGFLLTDLPLVLVVWLIFILLAFWDPDQKYTLADEAPTDLPSTAPFVSILIPARNEVKNIPPCLDSLAQQTYPRFEVIVIDDCSTDGTGEAVQSMVRQDPRFRLHRGKEPPPGWLGKPHALSIGVASAKGEWMVFLDADTRLSPRALAQTVAYALREKADMLNLFPRFLCEGFWEKAVQPFMTYLLFITGSLSVVNRPRFRSSTFALGQFILIRRSAYDAVGGHASVKDSFVEDLQLAKRVKGADHVTRSLRGMALIQTRMYRGFREVFSGWSRTAFPGLNRSFVLLFGGVFFLATIAVLPYLCVMVYAAQSVGASLSAQEARILAYSAAAIPLGLLPTFHLRRKFKQYPAYALTLPITAAVVAAMLLASAWRHVVLKNQAWKGRRYAPGGTA